VRFNASQLLGGNWEPYPIDMQFGPPCLVLSTIGLTSPGKIERGARAAACKNHLHQLHVCLPAGEGRTRLLYRMSLDFMHWTRFVPGIQRFWRSIAAQVGGCAGARLSRICTKDDVQRWQAVPVAAPQHLTC
jgi:chlorophyllide a oxygenase